MKYLFEIKYRTLADSNSQQAGRAKERTVIPSTKHHPSTEILIIIHSMLQSQVNKYLIANVTLSI